MTKFIRHYNGYIIEISTIRNNVLRYMIIDQMTYHRLIISQDIVGKTQEQVYTIALEKLKSEIFS